MRSDSIDDGADVKLDGYIGTVIADSFHLQILGFTLALVGMVAVISRMGGTGLVNSMSRFARGLKCPSCHLRNGYGDFLR